VNIALTNGRKPLGLLRRFLLLAGLFVTSVELAHSSEAPALIDRPNAGFGPTQISVGIWVADMSNIDSAQQTFTAEIAVVLRWKDPRLAHTGNGVVRYPLEQIWNPRVGIVNETNSVSRGPARRRQSTRQRRSRGRLRGSIDQFSLPAPSADCYPGLSSPKPRSEKRKRAACWLE
jgi:hypothetical protein